MTAKYINKSIASISSLAKALEITENELLEIHQKSESYYFITKVIPKPDGSTRTTYDVKKQLKDIHEKIKTNIFQNVTYPKYLQGGIKGRDYISNTRIHAGRKFLITEDISNFFPSINSDIVKKMWLHLFNFSPDVAIILTNLTTLNGFVPQGAKTSSYIANLILWDKEDVLIKRLNEKGMLYSRLVDDITVSCNYRPSVRLRTAVISEIFGMLLSKNVTPNRKKHKIMPAGCTQKIHNLNVNTGKPTLPKEERSRIRAAIHQCENMAKLSKKTEAYRQLFKSTEGRVNMLARIQPKQAQQFKERLSKIKP